MAGANPANLSERWNLDQEAGPGPSAGWQSAWGRSLVVSDWPTRNHRDRDALGSRYAREVSLAPPRSVPARRRWGVGGSPVLRRLGEIDRRPMWGLVAGVAGLAIWTVVALLNDRVQIHLAAPQAQAAAEVLTSGMRLFCAVVLFLFVAEGADRRRLRWVATGFVILSLGSSVFGYLPTLIGDGLPLNISAYAALAVATVAGVLFVIGLVPTSPPGFTLRSFLLSVGGFGLLGAAVVVGAARLPAIVSAGTTTIGGGIWPWHWVSGWYWWLSAVPLALGVAAAVGAVIRHAPGTGVGTWLVLAMVVFVGALAHQMIWPTTYQPFLTSTNLLRLMSAGILAVGGFFELRRAAAERTALLAAEQEHTRRLSELAALKADFTAMVAHELGSPIAAIRGWTDVLATGELDGDRQGDAFDAIRAQLAFINNLIADVQAVARDEREDFAVLARATPIDALVAEAAAVGRMLLGNHPLKVAAPIGVRVWADPIRIGQVLHNLLGNAARYSPDGTPIVLRATAASGRVRIEVVDYGAGIDPNDLSRIFEKFQRGRDATGQRVPGLGLGLYLSRRIVQMHGSELTVRSTRGVGSTFGFDLEMAG